MALGACRGNGFGVPHVENTIAHLPQDRTFRSGQWFENPPKSAPRHFPDRLLGDITGILGPPGVGARSETHITARMKRCYGADEAPVKAKIWRGLGHSGASGQAGRASGHATRRAVGFRRQSTAERWVRPARVRLACRRTGPRCGPEEAAGPGRRRAPQGGNPRGRGSGGCPGPVA